MKLIITVILILIFSLDLYLCNTNNQCAENFFDCGNGRCLSQFFVCDGDNDCGNFKDESSCNENDNDKNIEHKQCPTNEFSCNDKDGTCIPKRWICDGQSECLNNADEANCTNKNCNKKNDFQCQQSNECIPLNWKCDGINDCLDHSDERDCKLMHYDDSSVNADCDKLNNRYRCQSNGLCIDYRRVCDGHKDCPNGDDEQQHCNADKCMDKKCSHICFIDELTKHPVCACPPGYQLLDEHYCQDFDECQQQKQHNLCSHECVNTIGSYHCHCHNGYELQPDNRTCLVSSKQQSPILYFSTGSDIHGYDLRKNLLFPLITINDYDPTTIITLDVSIPNNQLYYSIYQNESQYSSIYQITINLNLNNKFPIDYQHNQLLFHHIKSQIEGISIDWFANIIYMTEANDEKILVCHLNTLICATLIDKLPSPRGITVVRRRYHLYWTQWHDSMGGIYQSRLDGSEMIKLFNDVAWPNDIVYDDETNRLYWCDGKTGSIEYYDFDNEIRRIVHDDFIRQPYSMIVFEETLYWTDWIDKKLFSCNKINCHEQRILFQPTISKRRGLYGITLYHPLRQSNNNNEMVDPCKNSGHGCSHLCLTRTNVTFTCLCPDHLYLSNDHRTCLSKSSDFLIISTGYRLYKFYPDSSSTEPFEMIPMTSMFLITDLAYNHERYEFYLYDRLRDRIVLATMEPDLVYHTLVNDDLNSVFGLTFEINSDNLYWVDMIKGTMEVVTIHHHQKQNYRCILNDRLDQPVSLAINALIKTIFVGLKSSNAQILMLTMDGTIIRSVLRAKGGFPFALVTYPLQNQLIWGDPVIETIDSIHLDYHHNDNDHHHNHHHHNGPKKLAEKHVGTVQSMAILNTTLYWTNGDSSRLYWMELNNRYKMIESKKVPSYKLDNDVLKVVSGFKHTSIYDYCLSNNNHCDHLCLIGETGPICRCAIGFDSQDEGRTCIRRNQSSITKPIVHVINLEDIFDFILSKQKDQIFDTWIESETNDTAANDNDTTGSTNDNGNNIDENAISQASTTDESSENFFARNSIYLWFIVISMLIVSIIVCIKLNVLPIFPISNIFHRQPQQTVITDTENNNNNGKNIRSGQVRFFSNPNYQLDQQIKNNVNNVNNNLDNDLLMS